MQGGLEGIAALVVLAWCVGWTMFDRWCDEMETK